MRRCFGYGSGGCYGERSPLLGRCPWSGWCPGRRRSGCWSWRAARSRARWSCAHARAHLRPDRSAPAVRTWTRPSSESRTAAWVSAVSSSVFVALICRIRSGVASCHAFLSSPSGVSRRHGAWARRTGVSTCTIFVLNCFNVEFAPPPPPAFLSLRSV